MEQVFGIILPVLLIIISSFIIWRSTDGFETAADYLGRNMNNGIKGATINAIASSMPEFLATLFFLFIINNEGSLTDSFSGGLGITAGSAVFNLVIIPTAIVFYFKFSGNSVLIPIRKRLIFRDGLILLLANFLMIILIRQKVMNPLDGLLLLLFYLAYLLVLRSSWKRDKITLYEAPVINKASNIPKAMICIDLRSWILGGRVINAGRAWLLLLTSVIIMSAGTWLLVKGTELLGENEYQFMGRTLKGLNFPLIFASVLLAAAASSIPDTMISIRDAKKGNYDDSISNALGSNIFDISFAIGVPLLLYTIIHGNIEMSETVRLWSLTTWIILFVINIMVIGLFFIVSNLGWKSGVFLLLIYLVFVFFMIEEGVNQLWLSRFVSGFLA